jgi:hypothetical protein
MEDGDVDGARRRRKETETENGVIGGGWMCFRCSLECRDGLLRPASDLS